MFSAFWQCVTFTDKDETMCAVALGYTCHLVNMISQILNFPVRYPMDHLSSRSTVTDHIHSKLTDRDKTYGHICNLFLIIRR